MTEFLIRANFKEITAYKPIYYIERFPFSFDVEYPVTQRFYRKKNGIITNVLVGIDTKNIYMIGRSLKDDKVSNFFIELPKKTSANILIRYIEINEKKINI